MGKSGSHALSKPFKDMLDRFGMEWREVRTCVVGTYESSSHYTQALGEAEAELARLNREKIIDAVMTDDGDALIFGARCVIRK